jgi:signal transduction histidine kinase
MDGERPISNLLSALAHDLGNELAAALLVTAVLRSTAGDADSATLGDLECALGTIRRKLETALALRRLIEGTTTARPASMTAGGAIDEAARVASIELPGGDHGDTAATVLVDRALVVRALAGLITRAAKVSRYPADVRVNVLAGQAGVTIAVDDSGPPEEVIRIGAMLRSAGGGVDGGAATIELAFARLVAELHGGSLGVAASAAGGATITIVLPPAFPDPALEEAGE